MDDFDVIIVGAGFAGLAAAGRIRSGRLLLIDKKPIGSHQTSACAAPLDVLNEFGLQDAILQVHHELYIHLNDDSYHYFLQRPYCTFNFRVLCEGLYRHASCKLVPATAYGLVGNTVHTTQGDFRASYVVDASGWRAVLAHRQQRGHVRLQDLMIGLETEVPFFDSGLHFWLSPGFPGYFWHFPCGNTTRFGVAMYSHWQLAKGQLENFMSETFGLTARAFHGGLIPTCLRSSVIGDLFVVGDAAGQCLGFTGEGIRWALGFGRICGSAVQCSLEGKTSKSEALMTYQQQVIKHRRLFATFTLLQRVYPCLPGGLIALIAWLVETRHAPGHRLPRISQLP